MNQNQPQNSTAIGIDGILSLRLGLDQIRDPSAEIQQAMAHLDKVLATICMGFALPSTPSSLIHQ